MPKSIPSHPANDYQMLRLKTQNLGVNFSRVPTFEIEQDRTALAVGLGLTHLGKISTSLQASHVGRTECDGPSSELDLCLDGEITNGHTCFGDLGSPAYVKSARGNNILVGIASTEAKTCIKRDGQTSLYTYVYKALNGIRKLRKECWGK